ncbi:hypothetical protein Ate01nite_45020 [Actinoplanes teichomyceticus]|nr:hypothetical protein Ate01nite_45020 [Actinoplanes teichomyceticus]
MRGGPLPRDRDGGRRQDEVARRDDEQPPGPVRVAQHADQRQRPGQREQRGALPGGGARPGAEKPEDPGLLYADRILAVRRAVPGLSQKGR